MLQSARTTTCEVVKHTNKANEIPKHKNKCKRGSQAQDQGQIMLQSTRTTTNEVVKHNNKCK